MSKVFKNSPQQSKLILEELEERRLFSGGIEGLIASDLDPEAQAIYADADKAKTANANDEASAAAAEQQTHEIVFVDAGVDNYQQLVDDLHNNADSSRNIEVVVLDQDKDGIEEISEFLSHREDLDAIHIISHGDDGSIQLGNTSLDNETLQDNNLKVALWANSFTESGDILIYGCNLAETKAGQDLIDDISSLTLGDVAASTDLTGHASLGGDWALEFKVGSIEAEVAVSDTAQQQWAGVLASFSVDTMLDTSDASPGNGVAEDGSGNTSIRAAIEEANALGGADTITIGAGTFTLSGGELAISSDISITGAGEGVTIIDGASLSRIFNITSGTVTISDLTIQNGDASGQLGGAILNDGDLVLNNVSLADNTAKEGGGVASSASSSLTVNGGDMTGNSAENGGAIWIKDSSTGLALSNVTLDGNSATKLGGGIFNEAGPMQITGGTISGNTAEEGGGVYFKGDDATLINVTISGNSATTLGGGLNNNAGNLNATNVTITNNSAATGSGVHQSGGTVSMQNSLVAGNSGSADVDGSYISLGYNLIGNADGSSGFTDGVNGDQVGTAGSPIDPMLGALADNGGSTQTHALLAGSLAIDAGTNSGAPITDQRGYIETDPIIDIGAYQFNAVEPNLSIGLQAHLTFDAGQGALDSSGNNHDGTLEDNAAVDSTPATNQIGDGKLTLDGTDDYVNINVHAAAIAGYIEGSISAWINTSSSGSQQTIFNFSDARGSDFAMLQLTSSGQLKWWVSDNGGTVLDVVSNATYNDGNWHHVAVTVGSSGTTLWIDGVELTGPAVSYGPGSAASTDFFNDLSGIVQAEIGAFEINGTMYEEFNGLIDDFRIYDRALTTSDVSELHAYTGATNTAPTDLLITDTSDGGLSLNQDGGNDAYLLAGDGAAIFSGLTATTMEIQFSSTTLPVDGGDADFVTYAAATQSSNNIWFGTWRNDAGAGHQLGLGVDGAYVYATGFDADTLFDGQEHTVSVTWEAGNYEFFVDGVSVGSGSGFKSGHTVPGGGALVVGMEQDSIGGGFQSDQVLQATVYDVRIFNDARTAPEILAGHGQTLAPTEPGMLANWVFDNLSTGGAVIDTVSGNDLSVMHASGAGFIGSVPSLTMTLREDAPDTTVVGSAATIDPDSGDTFTYTLLDNAGGRFDINSTTGEIFVLDSSLIDFENAASHNVTVQTTDSGGLTYDEVFTISITNANDAPTFGVGDGSVTTAIGAGNDVGVDMVLQPDGKMLVVGWSNNGTDNDFALTRYHADGTLDTSFGTGGIVTTAIGSANDQPRGVTLQADGKILVTGLSHNGTDKDFALVRYNADGTLDTSFSGDGIVTAAFGTANDQAESITVQADGKILVVGHSDNGSNLDVAIARFNSDGSLDTSFDGDGKVTTAVGSGADQALDVVVQGDGKIVVAGITNNGTDNDFLVIRYNTDGSLDSSFNGGGIQDLPIGSGADNANSVALQSDGKILVTGKSHNGADHDFAIVRLNTDGSLDNTFSGDGVVTTPVGPGADHSSDVVVQPDGKIVVAGRANNGTDLDAAVVRYNIDGTLDNSFSGDGIATTQIGSAADIIYSVALDADGKIVVAGSSNDGANDGFAVLRYNVDGSLDQGLGTGLLGANPTFVENGSPVVLDSDVTIYDAELSAVDNFDGATLTLVRNGGADADDVFSATGTLAALTEGGNLVVGGTTIGTATTNSAGTLVLTFDANATNALVDQVMQQIAYSNNSDAPPASVQIDWSFSDGNSGAQGTGGALQVLGSTSVNIVNVAPVLSVSGTGSVVNGGVYTLNLGADEAVDSWIINWGDGSIETVVGNPGSVDHTYHGGGLTYNVLVAATDANGTYYQNDLLVTSDGSDGIFRFDPVSGAFSQQFGTGNQDWPAGMSVGPDGFLYVGSFNDSNVLRYNVQTGALEGTFVTANSGGLTSAGVPKFGPDGNLYVPSHGTDSILRFSGVDGSFIDEVVATGADGLDGPIDILFTDRNTFLVSSSLSNEILEFDASTGASLGAFVTAAGNGGIDGPHIMDIGPDGNLYVTSFNSDEIFRYDGNDGSLIDVFVSAGANGLDQALGMQFGPDGHLYVTGEDDNRVIRFDGTTGAYIDDYVAPGTGGLNGISTLVFVPGHQVTVTNIAPIAVADAFVVNEDTPTNLAPLANDTDPENDTLTLLGFERVVASYDAGTSGSAVDPASVAGGSWLFEDTEDANATAGNLQSSDVSPDGASGQNAWNIVDGSDAFGENLWYSTTLSPADATLADTNGWSLSSEIRLVDDFDDTRTTFIRYGDGTTRFLAYFDLDSNNDLTVELIDDGGNQLITLTDDGNGSADYHNY